MWLGDLIFFESIQEKFIESLLGAMCHALGPEIDEHEREFIVESNVLNPQEIPGEITTTSLTLQTIFQPSSTSSMLFSSLSFPTPEGNVFSFVSPLYSQRTGKCINGNPQYIVIYLYNFFLVFSIHLWALWGQAHVLFLFFMPFLHSSFPVLDQ